MQTSQKGYTSNYSEQAPTLQQVESLSGDAILEFGAPWCPHCQASEHLLKTVLSEQAFQALPHIKIYDGKGKPLGRSFEVRRWPTFILLRDGMEVARIVRPLSAGDVRTFLQQL